MDYVALITAEAQAQGVPVGIALAVAREESGINQFNNDGSIVRSGAGALGIFQLMPATADGLGINPSDPVENIHGGVTYLKQQFAQFNSWPLAFAAYNCGAECVRRYLQGRRLPDETIKYVRDLTGLDLSAPAASAPTSSAPTGAAVLPIGGSYVMDDSGAAATDQSTTAPISVIVFGVLVVGAGLLWATGD